MDNHEEDGYIYVMEKYMRELEQKAKDSEYFRGRIEGMEYVIDAFENAFKGVGK